MTTLAGLSHNGVHAIAADSAAFVGDIVSTRRRRKVHLIYGGSAVFCSCGPSRASMLVEELETPDEGRPKLEHIPSDFTRRLASAIRKDGWNAEQNGPGTKSWGFAGILITSAGLSVIGSDFNVQTLQDGEPSGLGTGGEVARGAMEAMLGLDRGYTALEIVQSAVRVAARCDVFTAGDMLVAARGDKRVDPDEWIEL